MDVIDVVAAVIKREDGSILIAQRGPSSHLAGKWEFPGGKLEKGEAFYEALEREIWEELEVRISVGNTVYNKHHEGQPIRLWSFWCKILEGKPVAKKHSALKWVMPAELSNYGFPEADIPVVELLMKK